MLSTSFWIMVCYSVQVVLNHAVFFGGSGCESWCDILSQWLW
jgi:hypothetical protein